MTEQSSRTVFEKRMTTEAPETDVIMKLEVHGLPEAEAEELHGRFLDAWQEIRKKVEQATGLPGELIAPATAAQQQKSSSTQKRQTM